MWLTGRLTPDFKTIADFRKDNGPAIRRTCRQFIALCRQLGLFAHAVAAIDGVEIGLEMDLGREASPGAPLPALRHHESGDESG